MSVCIRFDNVSKKYKLGKVGRVSLQKDIAKGFLKLFGLYTPEKISEDEIYSLKNINFEVHEGETIGIIGRNGAGKSTLLKILSKITKPTSGEIFTEGRVASLLELGVGFHQEMTGRENIYLNGSILGMSKTEINQKIDEIISFSGIERFIDTPVKRYSSGMYSRLAFSVATHLDSEILLLDEILSVGDLDFHEKSSKKITQLVKEQGKTAVIVSHNLGLLEKLCDKILLLEDGEIKGFGTPEKIINQYLGKDKETGFSEIKNYPIFDTKVYLNTVRFRQNKKITRILYQGEIFNVMFIISNHSNEEKEIIFHLEFRDMHGTPIAYLGNRFQRQKIIVKPNQGKLVNILFEPLSLAEGNYLVAVNVNTLDCLQKGLDKYCIENMPVKILGAKPEYFENPNREWEKFPTNHKMGYLRIKGKNIMEDYWNTDE